MDDAAPGRELDPFGAAPETIRRSRWIALLVIVLMVAVVVSNIDRRRV